jgi:hypothetical protein
MRVPMDLVALDELPEHPNAVARSDLARVAEEYPDLTSFGFGIFRHYYPRKSPAEREVLFAQERADLLSNVGVEYFIRARKWLSVQLRTKNVNRKASQSYGLKHEAEQVEGYVTNGAFIAAAIAEGFIVQRCPDGNPNAWLNISSKCEHIWNGCGEFFVPGKGWCRVAA